MCFVLFIFSLPLNVSGKTFPWLMFVPATTGSWNYSDTSKSDNQLKTEMLAGYWLFTYRITSTVNSYYYLDISKVLESSTAPDQYFIIGEDQFGDPVVAGYEPQLGEYALLDPGPSVDGFYVFSFYDDGLVSGCYYQINYSGGSWSPCFVMPGTFLSSTPKSSTSKQGTQTENEIIKLQEPDGLNINPSSAIKKSYEQLKLLNQV